MLHLPAERISARRGRGTAGTSRWKWEWRAQRRFLPGPVPRENAGAGLRGSTREFLAGKLARLADSRARGAFAAPMWREDRAARRVAAFPDRPGLRGWRISCGAKRQSPDCARWRRARTRIWIWR